MRKILSGILAVFGVATLMLQVGPHDAATNFCNWLSYWPACAKKLPGWFDKWAWLFPTALLLIALILATWPLIEAAIKSAASPLKRSAWRSVPVTESNLSAYTRSSPLVRQLDDDEIAQNAKLPKRPNKTYAVSVVEGAKFFGIKDIAQLDQLLDEYQEAVRRVSSYTFTEHCVTRGVSIYYLFNVLGAQLGETRLRELNMLRLDQHMEESGIENLLNAYKEFARNHKIEVRVPLVEDFNLVPIENGLSLVRKRCRRSEFAKSLPKTGPIESELLSYFEHLQNKVALYGSLRGRNERALVGYSPQSDQYPPPGYPLRAGVTNPRFEAGKLIVDSHLFRRDRKGNVTAESVVYDRLYVLRPDLDLEIRRLNEGKA